MNERIRELYKQAAGKDWAYDFDPAFAEIFAELIVEECVKIVENTGKQCAYTTYDLGVVECTIRQISQNLKQEFAIKP